MSIFQSLVPTPPPTPQELTRRDMDTCMSMGYGTMTNFHNQLIRLFNVNPHGLTPAEAAAVAGTEGVAALALAVKVQEIVAIIASVTGRDGAADLALPSVGWQANPDGTIEPTPPGEGG